MSPATTLRRIARVVRWLPAATTAAAAGVLWAASRSRPPTRAESLPVPPPGLPPGRIVSVPGVGELFVRDTDETPSDPGRPTILLLHGWMFPSDLNWFTSYGPLSAIGRVLALDHRGHGRGMRPSAPFRLHDAADDAATLLRHLETGPAIVVGYSMGGPIAQLLWQRHPDLVAGLVLCATSADFTQATHGAWQWRLMGALQVALRVVPRSWWETLVDEQVRGGPIRLSKMASAHTPPEVRERLPWVIAELDRDSAEDVAEAGRQMARFDSRGWIGLVDVPTAVVVTTRDELVPVRGQRELASRIPEAHVVEVPLDHDAPAAAPGIFVPALREAVEWVLRAAASATEGDAAAPAPADPAPAVSTGPAPAVWG